MSDWLTLFLVVIALILGFAVGNAVGMERAIQSIGEQITIHVIKEDDDKDGTP